MRDDTYPGQWSWKETRALNEVVYRRKDFEANNKDTLTALNHQEFKRIWGQDERHDVRGTQEICSAKLRHRPDFRWCCSWVDRNNFAKYKLPNSFLLGPPKKPFVHVNAPALHNDDKPGSINGPDGQPRRFARIHKWIKKLGEYVEEGELLLELEIYNHRLIGKMNETGRYLPGTRYFDDGDYRDHEDQLPDNFVKNDKGEIVQQVRSTGEGLLTGLVREPGSKVLSFDNLAYLDQGDENWKQVLLPIDEWPIEFFSA